MQNRLNSRQIEFLRLVAEKGVVEGYNIQALREHMSDKDKSTGYFEVGDWVRVHLKDEPHKDYAGEERKEYLAMAEYFISQGYVELVSPGKRISDFSTYRITPKGYQVIGL